MEVLYNEMYLKNTQYSLNKEYMVFALAVTSQFFLFPIVRAHYTKCWLRYPMCVTYVTSVLYHATESNNWLIADIVASRTCTMLMFYHCVLRYRGTYAVFLLNNVGACYTISRVMHHFGSEWWMMWHMYFHVWSAITWFVAIYM